MAKSAIFRLLLGFFLLFLMTYIGHAEKIKLKDGRVIEGMIISVDITGVKIETEEGILMINSEDIESITKEEKTVRIYLKDGNKVEGRVLKEDKNTIRIEYSNVEWQIKREDIQRIETLSTKIIQYKAPLPPKRPEKKYIMGLNVRAGMNMMIEEEYKNGFIYSAGLSFSIHKKIALGLSISGFRSNSEPSSEILSKGKISSLPIQLSLTYRVQIKKFMPYISLGGSYYINSFTLDEEVYDAWNFLGFEIEEEIKNTFGFHYGIGLDYFFHENLAFNIDLKHNLASTSGNWTMKDIETGLSISGDMEDIKLNSFILLAGLKLYF
jgi:opacity protein-like surface antigen